MDALHVAGASLAGCEMLLTTETVHKPIFRTRLVHVIDLAAAVDEFLP